MYFFLIALDLILKLWGFLKNVKTQLYCPPQLPTWQHTWDMRSVVVGFSRVLEDGMKLLILPFLFQLAARIYK